MVVGGGDGSGGSGGGFGGGCGGGGCGGGGIATPATLKYITSLPY